MDRQNVGIIGGGPGGLFTAYLLRKKCYHALLMTLFEASDRLGGKIHTKQFDQAGIRYEAGAAELYDYSLVDEDPLREMITEFDLPTTLMGGSAVIMNNQILANLEDIRLHLGSQALHEIAHFDRVAKDWMSPREFYGSDLPGSPHHQNPGNRFCDTLNQISNKHARSYIETLIHSDLATEPENTSVSYGLQNYLMNDPAYMRLYTIEGGIERLPRELARRIDATVLLEQPVLAVGRTPTGKLRVTSNRQGLERHDEFDYLVVALPNNLLLGIRWEGERLATALHQHHQHHDHPAHYLRITLLFAHPFWRDRLSDSFFMADSFDGCCIYDESSRMPGASHGVLGWLLGGQAALAWSRLDDQALVAEALRSLPALLGDGREYFLEGHVHRWLNAVNGLPGGTPHLPLDRRHQPEPMEHPNLFVVGDYLFDSTLNGVFDSADHVTGWLAGWLAEKPGVPR